MFSWYAELEFVLIPLQLAFAMFGMGATLSVRDFAEVVRHPSGVAFGVGLHWLFVPLLGQVFIRIFGLDPGWAVGIILVTVTPGGAFSNLLTFLARGHTPLSISVSVVTTLTSVLMASVILQLLASSYMSAQFSFPTGQIVLEVFVYLLIPLGLGMAVLRYLPKRAKRISKWSVWTSMILVIFIAIGAMGSGRIRVTEYGWTPPLLIILFAVCVHFLSAELCRLAGRNDEEIVALSVEATVRNGGVGLLLVRFFFPGEVEQGHAFFTLLFYVGVQMWIPLTSVIRLRMGKSPLLFRKRRPRGGTTPDGT